jgi:hypothetical protein
LAGLPVGVVWWLLAPLPQVVKRADGLYRAGEGDESSVAADGWFALAALAAGILVALVVYLRTRPGRVGPLLGLVAGGLLGALVAWRTGALLGPGSLVSTAAGLDVGARFQGPLDLSAYGVLLAWPLGGVITYFAVAAGTEAAAEEQDDDRPGDADADGPDAALSQADPAAPSGPR